LLRWFGRGRLGLRRLLSLLLSLLRKSRRRRRLVEEHLVWKEEGEVGQEEDSLSVVTSGHV
jgi:hypothetical protein